MDTTTTCIGKWHLGWTWPTKDGQPPRSGPDRLSNVDFTRPIADGPTTRGFDSYFGVDVPNYPPYCYIENDQTVGIPTEPNRPEHNRPGPMVPGWNWVDIMPELTRRAVRTIDERRPAQPRTPFFLYFPVDRAPLSRSSPRPSSLGKSGAGEYGDFVAQVDWTVGQVLDALKRNGLADNTLVIFTSDNGPEITGEVKPGVYDRAEQYGHYSMGTLRGAKRDAWEGGHRVPFLVALAGQDRRRHRQRRDDRPVDLMATSPRCSGANASRQCRRGQLQHPPRYFSVRSDEAPIREATVHHAPRASSPSARATGS